jgi:hypothetical protein
VGADNYTAWNDGQPDDWNGIEDCIHLAGGGWNDNSCSKPYGFVCSYRLDEKPRGTCPEYCETEGVLSCEGHCEDCCSFSERQHSAGSVPGCPSNCVVGGEVKCTGSCKACCKPVTAATRPVPTPPPTMPDFVSQYRANTTSGSADAVLSLLILALSL